MAAASSDARAVDIRDLDVTFATDGGDVHAVRGVSLDVRPGEVLAIVGESGSGKTVTARSILGLLPETALTQGAVVLDGTDVIGLDREAMRRVRGTKAAMIFQEPSTALNPVFTVGWQLAEGLRAHGKYSKKQARERAIEMLGRVGIPDPERRVDDYPHQFSGGQKQRIVIATALALDPTVIIADEPTTALDVTVQAEILDLLRRLRDEDGTAIVLITHNMGVVADLADRVAVMLNGEVVETAPALELFAAPQNDYTKRLLAAVPRLEIVDRQLPAGVAEAAPVVVAEDLVIEYAGRLRRAGFRAVDHVSFSIAPGEVVGLVGESGSGKTTIGRAIAGLTPVTGGSLRVLGVEMNGVKERTFRPHRKDLGFVFQDPATSFNPLLTIAQNVAEPLVVHGGARDAADARDRVDELLEAVQLPKAFGDRFPHELSGGQRQRASLARGLALDPKLLIADEPTSALDVSVQARVLELFGELQERFGFATLFITHDLAVVDMLAHRVVVLHTGTIAETGPTARVLGDPQDDYTRKLIASLPVPDPVEQAARREAWRAARG
ncbi:ABC transporter ATP-binding protein [Microbacterium laevaniformans]|uniref:Glutathione import ATP-binding protein GsiA n=1 Tax=Microbacterium laevaniformans TaxID=36807 RepID=A0A150HD14_9MICO|nr:ABC transporter ATP-binding protein [Microbacterium laevaniformans]KXZ59997.1 Glutathione import ATP-binding protein GsiA [Microbacterium laevaniformans]MBM7754111.1 peptide/nickel transport system ATP-binding protein [Microbacterium laevaniformans]GLJ65859.1 ABC transporter ATP-binding protein [Microbacterium laevaniformans]